MFFYCSMHPPTTYIFIFCHSIFVFIRVLSLISTSFIRSSSSCPSCLSLSVDILFVLLAAAPSLLGAFDVIVNLWKTDNNFERDWILGAVDFLLNGSHHIKNGWEFFGSNKLMSYTGDSEWHGIGEWSGRISEEDRRQYKLQLSSNIVVSLNAFVNKCCQF